MARAGLDDLHRELMLYGWQHMEERMIEGADSASLLLDGATVPGSGYERFLQSNRRPRPADAWVQ